MKYARKLMEDLEHTDAPQETNVLVSLLSDPELSLDDGMAISADLLFAGVDTVIINILWVHKKIINLNSLRPPTRPPTL